MGCYLLAENTIKALKQVKVYDFCREPEQFIPQDAICWGMVFHRLPGYWLATGEQPDN